MSGNLREEGLYFGPTGNPFQVSESDPFAPGQNGKVTAYANPGSANGVAGNSPILVQAVRRYTTDTITNPTVGAPAFWYDVDNYIVTADQALATTLGAAQPTVAGVFAGTSLSWGSYGFIQVGGVAPALFRDSGSATTAGLNVVFSTGTLFKQAGTTESQLPVVGQLRTTVTVTVTASAEILLNPPRLNW